MPQPTATSPFQIAAATMEAVIAAEFTDQTYFFAADELHESLGSDGRIKVGVAPDRDTPRAGDMLLQETWFHVQWFGRWDPQIDPTQKVDPTPITVIAERLRRALRVASASIDDQVWYFNVVNVEYPRDPTGNKTRFVMTCQCYGTNSALVETTA